MPAGVNPRSQGAF